MGPRLSIKRPVPSFRPLAHFHHIGSVSGHLFAAANREPSKPPTRMKERFERAAKRWEDEVRKDLKYITFDLREVADTVDRLRSGVVAMVANGFESACLPSKGPGFQRIRWPDPPRTCLGWPGRHSAVGAAQSRVLPSGQASWRAHPQAPRGALGAGPHPSRRLAGHI